MVDCDLLPGMPLEAALFIIATEEPDAVIHLGSKTGYIDVEIAKDVRRKIDDLSWSLVRRYEVDRARSLGVLMDQYILYGEKGFDTIKYKKAMKTFMTAEKKLRSFVPLGSRQLKKCYRLISGGIAIILQGEENGDYWTLEDYEKEHHSENAGVLPMRVK